MASDSERRVALALLQDIEQEVVNVIGNRVGVRKILNAYDPKLDLFLEHQFKQCELAEKKAPDDHEVQLQSAILKAQICGNWDKPFGVEHEKATKYYEKAIALLGDDVQGEARVRYRYGLLCSLTSDRRQKATENFQRVMQICGIDSALGLESAKELEKLKDVKKGGCFIATATYGSPLAAEVLVFRSFRDRVLLTSRLGAVFVQIYYCVSPTAALFISKSRLLRGLTRRLLLEPILRLLEKRFGI